nr:prohibitin family protein [uncultured Desulfobulbus sp.]
MAPSEQESANTIYENFRKNWPYLRHRLALFLKFFLLVAFVLFAYFFNRIFINIYPGEAGVLWKRFHGGTDMDYVYNEGLHVIPPWNKMYIYDTRIHHTPFEFEALSKDGLPIDFEVSVRYLPDREYLPQLHTLVGPDYVRKVVKPEVQAHLRKVVANYLPAEIYTSEGYLLQIIMQGSMGAFAEKHIILDNLLIRRMILPKTIVQAIERKLTQEQYVQQYDYLLQTAIKEAKRKAIEAEGIKRFEDIVKAGNFFDKYLQFKGIDATVALAKSNNSKVVVIGGGEGNLPLIMNMDSEKLQAELPEPAEKSNSLPQSSSPEKIQPTKEHPTSGQQEITESWESFLSRLENYLINGHLPETTPQLFPNEATKSR